VRIHLEEEGMLIEHEHKPSVFDPGHCRPCAHQAGLLDHYHRVQREETNLRQAIASAIGARRYGIWALGSSGVGLLLALLALLTG
jgi:hypothetical protein